jgi:CMP/dCMP kinase
MSGAKRKGPVIAIDGPVGAGKSTVARALARALGYTYINTGAMYRAVAIAARDACIAPDDSDLGRKLATILASIRIVFDGDKLVLNGRDVTAMLSEPEIGDLASRFSTLAAVRARMRELQHAAGAGGCVVMEGRDIGTAVFPDAEVKFYLDADVKVRAQRRLAELRAKGVAATLQEVIASLTERDRRDSSRRLAPLRAASDAFVIDSTDLTIDQVVSAMKTAIGRYRKQCGT